ncbi:MAG: T9SS type A sorting domain-containing protein, partial [Chlorobi bacterium]|nr:T9SS type A sorting domain-containing protein [Chlorobiota bacterium]
VYANGPDGEGVFETSEPNTSFFEPFDANDWAGHGYGAAQPIIDLNQWAGQGNIKLRFESFNQYGNNLYIDNVEVNSTVGIFDDDNPDAVSIFPNPANNVLNVIVNYSEEDIRLKIFDMSGREMISAIAGKGNSQINIESLDSGVYIINIEGSGINRTAKLIIQ